MGTGLRQAQGEQGAAQVGVQTPTALSIIALTQLLSSPLGREEGAPCDPLPEQDKSMIHRWVSSVVSAAQRGH